MQTDKKGEITALMIIVMAYVYRLCYWGFVLFNCEEYQNKKLQKKNELNFYVGTLLEQNPLYSQSLTNLFTLSINYICCNIYANWFSLVWFSYGNE